MEQPVLNCPFTLQQMTLIRQFADVTVRAQGLDVIPAVTSVVAVLDSVFQKYQSEQQKLTGEAPQLEKLGSTPPQSTPSGAATSLN